MIADAQAPAPDVCKIEPRANGVMLVRVRSRRDHTLPEAVFTFRVGDPQYEYWKQRLVEQESGNRNAANGDSQQACGLAAAELDGFSPPTSRRSGT